MNCNYCDRTNIEKHNEDFYLLNGQLYVDYVENAETICLDCADKQGLEVQ